MLRKLGGLMIFAGALYIIGTAGASDQGLLEFGAIAQQLLTGFGLFCIGSGAFKIDNYIHMI